VAPYGTPLKAFSLSAHLLHGFPSVFLSRYDFIQRSLVFSLAFCHQIDSPSSGAPRKEQPEQEFHKKNPLPMKDRCEESYWQNANTNEKQADYQWDNTP
jgi:hypothetical protein